MTQRGAATRIPVRAPFGRSGCAGIPRALALASSLLLSFSACHLIYPFDTPVGSNTGDAASFFDSFLHPLDGSTDAVNGPKRVAGAMVLYLFDEEKGGTVRDQSGVGQPLDLVIERTDSVTWSPGKLLVHTGTRLACGAEPTKILDHCKSSNAFTVEAWIAPASEYQGGPARIVGLSFNEGSHNFVLGHGQCETDFSDTGLCVRRRTSLVTHPAGIPGFSTPVGVITAQVTHVVYSRAMSGDEAFHINGDLASSQNQQGDLSIWDSYHRLILANEHGIDRKWLGTYHLVAIYDRALSPAEITQNFNAGPDPELPP
jgi:hypothetical protein